MPTVDAPWTCAARMNSLLRMVSASARAMRAYGDHVVSAMASHRVLEPRAQGCDQGQREDQAGKGQEDVGDPHQHVVDHAADVSGHGTDQQADGDHDDADQAHDVEGDTRSPDDAVPQVPAELVGAEPVFRARAPQAVAEFRLQRVAVRDPRREDRHEHQGQDDAETGHGKRVRAKRQPGEVEALVSGLRHGRRRIGQQPGPQPGARGSLPVYVRPHGCALGSTACIREPARRFEPLMRVPWGRPAGRAGPRTC